MFTAERPEQCDPEEVGRIRLAAAEGCNPDVTVIDSDADALEDSLSVCRFSCKERRSEKVVGLSSTHCLLEAKDPLVAPCHQPVEHLSQKDPHTLRDEGFSKKSSCIEHGQISDFGKVSDCPRPKTDCRGFAR
jgi:hypothetical protein